MKDFLKLPNYNTIIVDTMNLAARSHYGMKNLSWNGVPTGMFYGVAKQAFKWRAIYPDARVIFLWEGTNSRRKSMDDSYKAGRTKDNDFRKLVQDLKPMLTNMNVDQMYHIGLEADDLAGYLVHTASPRERILLVSTDEDWFQFMRPNKVDLQRGDTVENYHDLQDSLGFPPDRMGIWKILKGDKSDEISGIKRFPAAAARLLANRCERYEQMLTYPLHKHNEKWYELEKVIKENWEQIKHNAEMILFHPEWIETSQIVSTIGKEDKDFLLKAFNDRGIRSLAKELI